MIESEVNKGTSFIINVPTFFGKRKFVISPKAENNCLSSFFDAWKGILRTRIFVQFPWSILDTPFRFLAVSFSANSRLDNLRSKEYKAKDMQTWADKGSIHFYQNANRRACRRA